MPTYEMPLLLRLASKAEYATTLKNVANSIFETGGFIRKIENWGNKELPCKAIAHGKTNTHAGHFMFCFDMPPSKLLRLEDDCKRNIGIIRVKIYKQNEPCSNIQCTLHEELLPPPYRPGVIKMMEEAKKNKRSKSKFEYGNDLNYHPFVK
ncbi:probable 28S ribosomal protein S6, mitochondrial [Frieseomelitta varia]|uniref:probable 28S ribosomal protein S6, mitochondrial n=1 Tax=Frieseomelitta varia TaxID=561572 RepID=UPI001CB6A88C|nr:probable 28S ribosomal protein S6, mitochondrial [Frieseomelitta varia]XP_043511168.1 probable 28S ribosomal protein S6, mitochondrial [Frieseomelitta varia]